ncbi:MAG: hypothetical protein V1763_00160 [Parcubacteria group bacterium]
MPKLLVTGYLDDFGRRVELAKALIAACVAVPELKLKPDDILVSFGSQWYGRPLIDTHRVLMIEVSCLSDEPERTREVKQRLADELRDTGRLYCSNKTEVFIYPPFDRTRGAYSESE